ncbi:MAG: homoserine kinase [Magnetospirillum sp.]|nr:homoserine kinase [Magnetospirillum sp.]
MAVYTEVSDEELEEFVAGYDIGEVLSFKGIAEGVENSNYLLQTDRGNYILTLYEKRTKPEDLPFFLGLMEHLAARGLACPTPLHGRDGQSLRELCGRPAAIVTFLTGMSARRLTLAHCAALGEAMAELHLKGADFPQSRNNDLSVAGWRPLFEAAKARADEVKPGLAEFIEAELAALEQEWPQALPMGVIHADLFPDNVFFRADKATHAENVSGLIDFYFACTDALAYDIAICLNAWCFEPDGSFNATKAMLMLNGYRKVRPLSVDELQALPLLARGAAMRFLLTRLYDWLNTPAGAFVKRKDPLEYYRKLRFHQGITGPGAYGIE